MSERYTKDNFIQSFLNGEFALRHYDVLHCAPAWFLTEVMADCSLDGRIKTVPEFFKSVAALAPQEDFFFTCDTKSNGGYKFMAYRTQWRPHVPVISFNDVEFVQEPDVNNLLSEWVNLL